MVDPQQMAAMAGAMQPAVGGPPAAPQPMDPTAPMGGPVMAAQPQPEQKKPPLLLPPTLAKSLANGYVDQVKAMSQLIADQSGPPDDFTRFPLKEQVAAWHKRDARQNPYELKQQGMSDTEIRDKVYPLRPILLKMAGPRPIDRVKFAQKMKAERERMATI